MTAPLYHLGRFCARHHWITIAVWIVAAVGLAMAGKAAGHRTSDNLTLPGTGSTKATDVLEQRLPDQAYGSNPLVLRSHDGKLTDSKNKEAVDDAVDELRKTPHVLKAVNPLSDEGAAFLSKDKTIAYVPVTLDVSQSDITKGEAQQVLAAGNPARDAGLAVSLGGYAGQQLSKPSTHQSEAIGLAAAVLILLFAFGTATAMALPIATAILGLVSSLALISVLGRLTDVPTTSPTLATMIGLGVGIDYALFIVTRHKLQLKDGMEMRESIARAAATAGGAVVFAGITVVIALVSLVFSGIPFVGNMGYSAAVAVLVAVTAAVTLLPALLGALGERIHSLRVQLGRTHPDDHQPHGWARWARGVVNRPWRSLVASVAFLLVLALPVLNLELGASDNSELPKSTTAHQAFELMSEGFGPGSNGPLLIGVELGSPAKPDQSQIKQVNQKQDQLNQQIAEQEQQLEATGVPASQAQQQVQQQTASQSQQLAQQKQLAESPATDTRLTDLENAIKKDPGIKSVSPATVDKKGTVAVFTAVPTTAPSDPDTIDTVNRLRDTVVPNAI